MDKANKSATLDSVVQRKLSDQNPISPCSVNYIVQQTSNEKIVRPNLVYDHLREDETLTSK